MTAASAKLLKDSKASSELRDFLKSKEMGGQVTIRTANGEIFKVKRIEFTKIRR